MIVEFDDQAWSLGKLCKFVKERNPVDGPITGSPVAVEMHVTILEVDMAEKRACLTDPLIGGWPTDTLHD